MSTTPALGKKAPDFDLPVVGGGYGENDRLTLADLKGSKVVLYFYPKDAKFIAKYELPFPLLSDEAQTMVEAYGVWVEKSMYGKTYMGTERTTFVLDENGIVKAVFPKVKPAEHVDLVLEALD